MKILNQPIATITFKDVVDFCQEGNVEGVQVDYKTQLPKRGLSKHFASFSNTRGGLIILGVAENSSGKPEVFEGLKLDTKLVDQIHQFATSVEPRPSYDVSVTNEISGKSFILIRIYEGTETPYYVQNDPNIYIRTGNITDPIDIANPKVVEGLFEKRSLARIARKNSINRTIEVYKSALERAEKERLRLIAEEKENYQILLGQAKLKGEPIGQFKSKIFQESLGNKTSMFTLLLQPYNPSRPFLALNDIKLKVDNVRVKTSDGDFPDLNLKPIQDGIIHFFWNQNDGGIECQQIYSNGLIFHSEDVLRIDEDGRKIYLSSLVFRMLRFLKFASGFYTSFPYQGVLSGYIKLEGANDTNIIRIEPRGHFASYWDEGNQTPVMKHYIWNLDLDTSVLFDDLSRQNFLISKIQEIYWSLGYENPNENLIKDFFKENGWLIE